MAELTKEQIESVSTLIQACKGVGATYHEDKIVFADGEVLACNPGNIIEGDLRSLKIHLLKRHTKIIQEKA